MKLFSEKQVEGILGLRPKVLAAYRKMGDRPHLIPPYEKRGGRYWYPQDALVDWLAHETNTKLDRLHLITNTHDVAPQELI